MNINNVSLNEKDFISQSKFLNVMSVLKASQAILFEFIDRIFEKKNVEQMKLTNSNWCSVRSLKNYFLLVSNCFTWLVRKFNINLLEG